MNTTAQAKRHMDEIEVQIARLSRSLTECIENMETAPSVKAYIYTRLAENMMVASHYALADERAARLFPSSSPSSVK